MRLFGGAAANENGPQDGPAPTARDTGARHDPQDGTITIELRDLHFGYDPENPVIRGVDLTFDKPEFVCIMGPNGVGKSTLIHCINKILKPTGGEVLINGKNVADMKLKEVASYLGYVPATSQDSFPLTVVDTVMVGLQNDMRLSTTKDDLAKVRDTLKLMKIEHLAMRNFDELSAGQHQKVVLARGLVRSPPCVLLDEPTSNLDINHQLQVTKVLSELPEKKGMLVIMISHDINITAKYAHRIVMIHDGVIFADGPAEEVLTKENIRTVYNVDSDIVMVNGRPHVVLNDAIDEESEDRRPGGPREETRSSGGDRPPGAPFAPEGTISPRARTRFF